MIRHLSSTKGVRSFSDFTGRYRQRSLLRLKCGPALQIKNKVELLKLEGNDMNKYFIPKKGTAL